MICHQRKIREEKAQTPLPDEKERRAAAVYSNARIEWISKQQASEVILDYEWLGNMGSTRFTVGLFFGEYLAGVACFGNTAGSMVTRSICGTEHSNKVLTLVRGTCVHWAPKDAASYLINKACDLVAREAEGGPFNIFIAYSDEDAGEIGTVYQASNWLYVGKGGAPTLYVHPDGREKDSRCLSVMGRSRHGRPNRKTCTQAEMDAWVAKKKAEGKIVHLGKTPWVQTMSRKDAENKLLAEGFVKVKGMAKHRYLYFAGDKRTVRELKRALKLEIQPYPKRKA